jgi:hypothetical protein
LIPESKDIDAASQSADGVVEERLGQQVPALERTDAEGVLDEDGLLLAVELAPGAGEGQVEAVGLVGGLREDRIDDVAMAGSLEQRSPLGGDAVGERTLACTASCTSSEGSMGRYRRGTKTVFSMVKGRLLALTGPRTSSAR